MNLEPGTVLIDTYHRETSQQIKLLTRVNPVGDTPAYWQCSNLGSGVVSIIRENELLNRDGELRHRWSVQL